MATFGRVVVPVLLFAVLIPLVPSAKKNQLELIDEVNDIKEWKKLMRTRTNVLAIFTKTKDSAKGKLNMLAQVAEQVKGQGTLVLIDCTNAKKMCKKLKVNPSGVDLKHYKDGEFNKDYDRKDTVKSMVNFMKDPKGDMPWEEDATARDVLHLETRQDLAKALRTEKRPMLIMFYAPWCGYCKKIKPDYSEAATELKREAVMAGMDVDRPENMDVRMEYNITGFPTMIYFENGAPKYKYGGENNKDGLVKWMRDPQPPKEAERDVEWADTENDVVHLTDSTFDSFVAENPSVLVMFYAPWCGHCKNMKPDYEVAATTLKEENIVGAIAAIDATKEKELGGRFEIKGFPTVKYFKDGQEAFDVNERTSDKIVAFMKDPKEPPPPPPPEAAWEDTPSEVLHLTDDNFKQTLKKKKHSLVMFYAPWCGHCKKAKPEYMAAAEKLKENSKVAFVAVDCTQHQAVCSEHDVAGYPTFKYFNYGKNPEKYTGGREEADFVHFMKDPLNPASSLPPPPPPPEAQWKDIAGHEALEFLSEASFDSIAAKQDALLVMFYAPWCGHCKTMKPAYGEAAQELKDSGFKGALAAVDATIEKNLASRFEVKGYPTLKFFKKGIFQYDYDRARSKEDLVEFMRNPVKTAEPPVEPKWSDDPSSVHHLDSQSFKPWLLGKQHSLIMFYAPWCGHCKKAKPEFTAAANEQGDKEGRYFAAMDCTESKDICTAQEVKGYPTFLYFANGRFVEKYTGGRAKPDFLKFLRSKTDKKQEL